ncbi:MAG: DEAD/DEAH box helicase family protein [Spirochaetia bacterium]|nr:DEAD/DEAH box helicase family protein [Spirochaetia bacterium]MCI7798300.1 DEAD/DEAH box helicase family protein [Spirochaetia bacterium]MDY3887484.1 helicase C-terminal domain-containing protein [Treponema sp.]
MNSKIEDLFSSSVIKYIRSEIASSNENEVFFVGEINHDGKVTSVSVGSRGNLHSVPVNQDLKRKGSVLIHNHPGGNLTPSDADLSVAAVSSENAQGFYIINNDVTEIYVVVEPVLPKVIKKLDVDDAAFYISKDGPLAKINENFEERLSQIELLKNIAKTFNQNKTGVFEAGTGVGKSYAYLIPSILWAVQNNERVVISTGTINLQQQLCLKDIPQAIKITGKPVKFILMKGRQNYICKRRLQDALNSKDLFENNDDLDRIAQWQDSCDSGSKSELSFLPSESVWNRINSESDACMALRCPYYSQCFVMKVKKEASAANILVVNHHLLFADIESRLHGAGYDDAVVLPPYKRIIFDEAHGIETAATSFFSESFNRFKILKPLNLLYRKKKNSAMGFLFSVSMLSKEEEKSFQAYQMISKIKSDLTNLETLALDLCIQENNLWLNPLTFRNFQPVLSMCQTLAKDISVFTSLVLEVLDGVPEDDRDIPYFWETKVLNRRLSDYSVILNDFFMWEEKPDKVFWLQKKNLPSDMQKDDELNFYINFIETPLDIAPLMNQGIFEPMDSVVCTSATLKTGRDFSYWLRHNGLYFSDSDEVLQGEFFSPFPYKENMIFLVPKDIPFPDEPDFQIYVENVLKNLILKAKGRTLVLFTSYESLRLSYNNIFSTMLANGIKLLRQGSDDNARILKNFKDDVSSVLFATDSFWQGVDVPGESLSQVIIVKLPFTVPNDPVFKARSEAIRKKGGNSFMELSVPEAIIKFRQGVGRLIRKNTDKGTVVVLDRRIYEKQYGSLFLANVPECKKYYEPVSKILDIIEEFLD